MKRRTFLKNSLVGLGALFGNNTILSSIMPSFAQDSDMMALDVKGAILNVHDPVLIKHEDYYYMYHTGVGIPIKRSRDLIDWRISRGSPVFQSQPEEAFAYVPGADAIWAPDISFYNDRYHLYYSVSTFGSSHSAIGLATNVTLNPEADEYDWVDHGIVVKSDSSSNWNAIDANLILDAEDEPWLVFGSHWSGIKMIKLDFETGKQSEDDDTLYSVAARAIRPRAIEAPFIVYKDEYYYLFVSFDQCCNGINSTYNVRVGRSEAVTGPYIDQDGVDMMDDGGTQVTFPTSRYKGPGHNAVFEEDGQYYMVYHAYDAVQGGTPTLRIDPISWDDDGWPFIVGMQAEA